MDFSIDLINPYYYNYYYSQVSMPEHTEEEITDRYKSAPPATLMNVDVGQLVDIFA